MCAAKALRKAGTSATRVQAGRATVVIRAVNAGIVQIRLVVSPVAPANSAVSGGRVPTRDSTCPVFMVKTAVNCGAEQDNDAVKPE